MRAKVDGIYMMESLQRDGLSGRRRVPGKVLAPEDLIFGQVAASQNAERPPRFVRVTQKDFHDYYPGMYVPTAGSRTGEFDSSDHLRKVPSPRLQDECLDSGSPRNSIPPDSLQRRESSRVGDAFTSRRSLTLSSNPLHNPLTLLRNATEGTFGRSSKQLSPPDEDTNEGDVFGRRKSEGATPHRRGRSGDGLFTGVHSGSSFGRDRRFRWPSKLFGGHSHKQVVDPRLLHRDVILVRRKTLDDEEEPSVESFRGPVSVPTSFAAVQQIELLDRDIETDSSEREPEIPDLCPPGPPQETTEWSSAAAKPTAEEVVSAEAIGCGHGEVPRTETEGGNPPECLSSSIDADGYVARSEEDSCRCVERPEQYASDVEQTEVIEAVEILYIEELITSAKASFPSATEEVSGAPTPSWAHDAMEAENAEHQQAELEHGLTGETKDGTQEMKDGTEEMKDSTQEMKDSTPEVTDITRSETNGTDLTQASSLPLAKRGVPSIMYDEDFERIDDELDVDVGESYTELLLSEETSPRSQDFQEDSIVYKSLRKAVSKRVRNKFGIPGNSREPNNVSPTKSNHSIDWKNQSFSKLKRLSSAPLKGRNKRTQTNPTAKDAPELDGAALPPNPSKFKPADATPQKEGREPSSVSSSPSRRKAISRLKEIKLFTNLRRNKSVRSAR